MSFITKFLINIDCSINAVYTRGFTKAIELDLNYASAYYNRGFSKTNLKDNKEQSKSQDYISF